MAIGSGSTERCGRHLTLDEETRHSVAARRNVLLALWGAGCMELAAHLREAYAWAIHFTSPRLSDEALVERLVRDARRAGIRLRKSQVRRQMQEMELRAYLQLASETKAAGAATRRSASRRPSSAKILAFPGRRARAGRSGTRA